MCVTELLETKTTDAVAITAFMQWAKVHRQPENGWSHSVHLHWKNNHALDLMWVSTNKRVNKHSKDITQTQQQRPESPTVNLTWHVSKYKAHKLHLSFLKKSA